MSSIWQTIVLGADTCGLAFLVSPYLSMTMNYDFEMIGSLCLLIVYFLIFFRGLYGLPDSGLGLSGD